jgi:hypothetical protein
MGTLLLYVGDICTFCISLRFISFLNLEFMNMSLGNKIQSSICKFCSNMPNGTANYFAVIFVFFTICYYNLVCPPRLILVTIHDILYAHHC